MAEFPGRVTLTFILCMALPVSGAAQGTRSNANALTTAFTGQVGDEQQQWLVSLDRSLPTATFSTLAPGVHQIWINAYSGEPYSRANSLQIEFTLRETGQSWQVSGLELRHFPFDALHPRFSQGRGHGNAELRIRSFEADSRGASITADLDATLFYHQSTNTRPISQRTETIALSLDLDLKRN